MFIVDPVCARILKCDREDVEKAEVEKTRSGKNQELIICIRKNQSQSPFSLEIEWQQEFSLQKIKLPITKLETKPENYLYTAGHILSALSVT